MSKARGQSLSARAYARIRADILTGVVPAGRRLVISDLARDLGLNPGAVREALSRLDAEGLVVGKTNKGFAVPGTSREEFEALTRTRVLVECECLARAIRNGDLAWETGIVSALFTLSRLAGGAGQGPATSDPDWADGYCGFHRALLAGCDSPWLLRLREMLAAQAERYRVARLLRRHAGCRLLPQHRAIVDAALARDIPAATAALRAHLLLTRRILAEAETRDPAVR